MQSEIDLMSLVRRHLLHENRLTITCFLVRPALQLQVLYLSSSRVTFMRQYIIRGYVPRSMKGLELYELPVGYRPQLLVQYLGFSSRNT